MNFDCPGLEFYFPRDYYNDLKFKETIERCYEVVAPLLPMEGANLENIEQEGYFSIDIPRFEYVNEEFLNKVFEDSLNYFKYLGAAVHLLYKAYKNSEAEEAGERPNLGEFIASAGICRRLWFECAGSREIIPISQIAPPHYGKFVSISGSVASISNMTETIYEAAFRCDKCSSIQYVLQPMGRFQMPKACPVPSCKLQSRNNDPGKGFDITFSRVKESDIKVNSQVITVIQSRYEGKPKEKHIDVIKVQLVNHLVEKCFIMDSVTVSGVIVEPKNSEEAGICSFYMLASSMSQNEKEKFSGNVLKGIQAITSEPDILSLIIASFCPSVSCSNIIKLGVLLSLVGGHDSVNSSDEESIDFRGQIHVLLLGAPNIEKKDLLNAAHLAAPISTLVDKNYTQNLVYDVKVDKGEETLHAGPILQANKGVSIIDDLDFMKSQWNSISGLMDAQTFQVAKKSFIKKAPVDITLIASSTPAGGTYRPERTLYENIKMPTDMLNQFDLILHLVDEPDHASDRSFAKKILKRREGRSSDEASSSVQRITSPSQSRAAELPLVKRLGNVNRDAIDLLPLKLLRKYIQFVRSKVFPVFDQESTEAVFKFKDEYQEKAFRGVAGPNCHPSDAQILSSLMRLSIARARLEYKTVVSKRDVLDVIELIKFTRSDIFPKDVLSSLNSQSSLPQYRRPIETPEGLSGLTVKRARSSNERFIRLLEEYFSENPETEFTLDDLYAIARTGPPVARFEQMVDYLNLHGFMLQRGHGKYRWVARR